MSDIEKNDGFNHSDTSVVAAGPEGHLVTNSRFTRHPFFQKLFSGGVEALGVERVREEDRIHKRSWLFDNLWFWFSVNTVLTTCKSAAFWQIFVYS